LRGRYISIVGGNDCHNINSLLFEIAVVLNIRREMFDLTSWSECSRNSKQNDLFPFEFLLISLSGVNSGVSPFERRILGRCRRRQCHCFQECRQCNGTLPEGTRRRLLKVPWRMVTLDGELWVGGDVDLKFGIRSIGRPASPRRGADLCNRDCSQCVYGLRACAGKLGAQFQRNHMASSRVQGVRPAKPLMKP
jgi:hypothetical protein